MNERIQELELEAYKWAVKESQAGLNVCSPGSNYFLALEKEKFAQLVIQECVQVARKSVGEDEPNEAWYLIKEHFGVEE